MSRKEYITDKRYPGVRKRSIGYVEYFGEDFMFSMNCRDKNQGGRVRYDQIGKASEGWTMQKAYLEKERILAEGQIIKEKPLDEVTLQDIFQDYSQYYAREKARYIKEYRTYSKKIAFFATKPVKDIKNRDMQNLRKELEESKSAKGKPYAPKTVRDILKLVRMLINYGSKRELCIARPDLLIEMPRVDNQVTEFLNQEQLTAYKKALDEDRDKLGVSFLKIAMYTGMRPKAILNLMWSDIDYENNRIKLRAETAKNNTTDYIPLTETVKVIIADIPKTEYSVYLFEQKNGLPRCSFAKTARRIRNKAGLPKDFRPTYMLRHNFATQLASSGEVELYTIQKLLTHKSPEMTQRYAHLMDKTKYEASKVVENILNQG